MQPLAGTSINNWIKLLVENRFGVDWQFIPKALYITFMVTAITPFRLYEKIKFSKKVEHVKLNPLLFIVGHFRGGTTFLHYLMGQDEALTYLSTMETMAPWVFLENEQLFGSMVKKHLPEKRPMDDLEMSASLPYEDEYAMANLSPYSFYHGWYFPRKINHYFRKYVLFENVSDEIVEKWKLTYSYLLKKISYKHKGKKILLKSLVNTGRIKLLLDTFSDSKFIHIYRNPYKVYLSTWRLYEKILPLFSFQHVKREEMDSFILEFYKKIYTKYLDEKKLIPKENIVELKYENFIKDPVKILGEIYEKLELKGFKKAQQQFKIFVDKHKSYKPHHYEIDEHIRKKIYNEWEFAFKQFGYKK
jgi:hypothetical protein